MYKLQTQIEFEAAHRLYDVDTYSEECRNNIHGHSYKVTFIIGREELNSAGMVIDFKLLKKVLKSEIEDVYDHSCILTYSDPLAEFIKEHCKKVHIVYHNPTAEWMSYLYFKIASDALFDIDPLIKVISVAVQETEHNIAIYEE